MDELLRRFLDSRDARCPGCGHGLRSLRSARCPEGGLELTLDVARARENALPWTVLVVALLARRWLRERRPRRLRALAGLAIAVFVVECLAIIRP